MTDVWREAGNGWVRGQGTRQMEKRGRALKGKSLDDQELVGGL
jgi:hypothetical protein